MSTIKFDEKAYTYCLLK